MIREIVSILILSCSFLQLCCLGRDDESLSSVLNIKIPGFDTNGFLSWEIYASKVSPQGENLYFTENPTIHIYRNKEIQSSAKSNTGHFNLKKGEAWGEQTMHLDGDGFYAKGDDWHWFENGGRGANRIIFKRETNISFIRGLGDFFAFDDQNSTSICSSDDVEDNQSQNIIQQIPTTAQADYLEFLSVEKNNHRFLLDGNVSVEGNNLYLTCDRIELLFVGDSNGSSGGIGKIDSMEAKGNVVLKQRGRQSYADEMTLNVPQGTAELRGSSKAGTPARVVDEEWGEAKGDKIILEKGKRLAKVIGGKSGRPRIEFPSIPDLGFDKKNKLENVKP